MDEMDYGTFLTPDQHTRVAALAARIIPNGWNWCVEPRYSNPAEYVAYISGITPGKWHTHAYSSTPDQALKNAKRNAKRLLGNILKYTLQEKSE